MTEAQPRPAPSPLCRACGTDLPAAADFCPRCGEAVVEDPTLAPFASGEETVTAPAAALPAAQAALPSVDEARASVATSVRVGLRRFGQGAPHVENRPAGLIAVVAGLVAAMASFQPWVQIHIAGATGPGSADTGLDGRDGRTVLVVGLVAAVVGLLLVAGRGYDWLKVALLVTGGITTVIAIVDVADVNAKATQLEDRFGIPADVVTAEVGVGLWMVAAAGVAMIVAGLLARRPPA
jgi:hypothetical protein